MWLDLSQLKGDLDKDSTKDDGILIRMMQAACARIEEAIGRVEITDVTETVTGTYRQPTVRLSVQPVIEIVSIDVLNYVGQSIGTLDAPTGPLASVSPASATWRVVYRAGLDPIPANVLEAGYELAAHYYRRSQLIGSGGRIKSGQNETVMGGVSSALPYFVKGLLGLTGDLDRNETWIG